MGRQANQSPARRQRRGCLGGLFALLVIIGLLALGYIFVLKPMLSSAIADQLVGPAKPSVSALASSSQAPPGAIGSAQNAALDQAAALLPSAIAALPTGEVVVKADQLNAMIAAHPTAIAPLEQATLHFTKGSVVATVAAFGLTGTATIGLAAQDGRLVVTSAKIDDLLAPFVHADTLTKTLTDRFNAELAAQGRRIDDLRIEEGQLVLVTS